MSRGTKVTVCASLVVTAAGMVLWAWFLSRGGFERAALWSGVLQGLAAFLGVPALILGVLALRTTPPNPAGHDEAPGDDAAAGPGIRAETISGIASTGDQTINIQQR